MPGMRYISVPEDVHLVNPVTREPFSEEKPVTFQSVIDKLLSNPKWAESYTLIKSADAIVAAMDSVKDGVVTLAEDDWQRLKDAVENPRIVAQGPGGMTTIPGFGYHPSITRQLLPFLKAIIEAKDKAPSSLKAVEG